MNIDFEEELFYKSRENVYRSIIDDLRRATGEIGIGAYNHAIVEISDSVEFEVESRLSGFLVGVIDMLDAAHELQTEPLRAKPRSDLRR